MRHCLRLFLALVALPFASPLFAQTNFSVEVPQIPFDSIGNILKELPAGMAEGEPAGVAVNSKGHIFVECRCGDVHLTTGTSRAFGRGYGRLREYDQTGKFIREIGENSYGAIWAERVRIDAQDNVWVIDDGAHVVMKLDPDWHLLMVLGRRPEAIEVPAEPEGGPTPPGFGAGIPGDNFERPVDVAFDPAGNIFVADGHGGKTHARVVKLDKNGRFIKAWGSKGSGPGEMDTPHSIAVDRDGNVYVADRGNSRIQVFDNDGNLKHMWYQQGTPFALCITNGPHQYLYSVNANLPTDIYNGETYKMELDGTVLGQFGKSGRGENDFGTVHSLDCSKTNENEVYESEFMAWRVHKVVLHPEKMAK